MRRLFFLDLTETNMFLERSLICLACVEKYNVHADLLSKVARATVFVFSCILAAFAFGG